MFEEHDGLLHKLQSERGERVMRDEKLRRWLKEAFDAASDLSDSFERRVILERLTDALEQVK